MNKVLGAVAAIGLVGAALGQKKPDAPPKWPNNIDVSGEMVIGGKTMTTHFQESFPLPPVPLNTSSLRRDIDKTWTKVGKIVDDRAHVEADLDVANGKLGEKGAEDAISKLELKDRELGESMERVLNEFRDRVNNAFSRSPHVEATNFTHAEKRREAQIATSRDKEMRRLDALFEKGQGTAYGKLRADLLARASSEFYFSFEAAADMSTPYYSTTPPKPKSEAWTKIVSFEAKDEEVKHLIHRLIEDQSITLDCPPELTGMVTMRAKTVPLGDAIAVICREVGADMTFKDKTWTVRIKKPAPAPAASEKS